MVMLNNLKTAGIFFLFLTLAVFVPSGVSHADHWSVGVSVGDPGYHHEERHEGWHEGWHNHPGWGYHEHYLPRNCYNVLVEGAMYHYCDGLYYANAGYGDYVLVNPPMGAYVSAIPPDFQAMVINGRTYYTSEGVYYVGTPRGYRVVSQPVIYEQPPAVVAAPAAPSQNEFTINVPNSGGSFTPVVIRRSGNGYTGPQGEFYPQFPSVSQLKAMYGK